MEPRCIIACHGGYRCQRECNQQSAAEPPTPAVLCDNRPSCKTEYVSHQSCLLVRPQDIHEFDASCHAGKSQNRRTSLPRLPHGRALQGLKNHHLQRSRKKSCDLLRNSRVPYGIDGLPVLFQSRNAVTLTIEILL